MKPSAKKFPSPFSPPPDMLNKLVVILGPTASGKSALAIKLAKKFNGEIISADSRQVYKGMDLGTGKVTKKEQRIVPHHLLDITSPKKQYSVARYQRDVKCAAAQITSRGKIPFLVGGTAFYIYAVIDDLKIPEVKPNLKLRRALAKKPTKELFIILKNLDPRRAKTIERKNRVRLIRAIEINVTTGKPVPISPYSPYPPLSRAGSRDYSLLILGLDPPNLKKLIAVRVWQRFRQGLVSEVKKLLKSGISLKRLKQIGLTYSLAAEYIEQGLPKNKLNELKQKIKITEWQFAKRQMTWFKRDHRIHWINNQLQAEAIIRKFLKP